MNLKVLLCLGLSLLPALGKTNLPDIRDSYGVALADFDQDGLIDVYLVGFRTLNRLLINNGDGTFRDKSIPAGVGGNLMPQGIRNLELGASAADFDNDGAVDLLICGWGDALDLLKNRKDGTFFSVTRRAGLARDVDANMGIWGDLDADGYLDLLLTNEQGPVRLYRNDHGWRFLPMPLDSVGIASDTGSQGALWSDLDLDGDLDLILAGWRNPLRVYEQVSPFRFREVSLDLQLPAGTRCNAVLPGDIDNDGDADFLITVRAGPNLLMVNQADPERQASSPMQWVPGVKPIRFREESAARGLRDTLDSYGGAFGDYDGDGDQDLFLTTRGTNFYYRNGEEGRKGAGAGDGEGKSGAPGRFRRLGLAEAGLYDDGSTYNTGFMFGDLTPAPGEELVTVSRDSACTIQDGLPIRYRRIKVLLRGVQSNQGAIGSAISLWGRSGEGWSLAQGFQVYGGAGYLSSYVGPQAIYLADSASVQRLRVRFPGGKVVVRKVNPKDTLVEIWEGGFLAAAWERGQHLAYNNLRDPMRRREILLAVLALVAGALLLRAALKAMAGNIARKQYTRELVEKNRKLQDLIQEVNRTQEQLIHSEKLAGLGQLVAGIAHELNNPIGFIYANLYQIRKYLEGLERGEMDDAARATLRKVDQALKESQEGSIRIRDIVQNLRGLSRAGSPRPGHSLQKQPCDLNQLLDKTLVLAQTNFSKNIGLEKTYGALPLVEADETQVQQVFLNILVNAGQAMGEKGSIRLRTYAEGGMACISIADDGPGISEENLKHIFEPFFTTKPVGQGIGLGLHICYQIISAHQGRIEALSAPGQGARFLIKLPLDAKVTSSSKPVPAETGEEA